MGFNQIIMVVGLLVSIVAVFFAELAAYSGLLLVIFGLTSGFVSPMADTHLVWGPCCSEL